MERDGRKKHAIIALQILFLPAGNFYNRSSISQQKLMLNIIQKYYIMYFNKIKVV